MGEIYVEVGCKRVEFEDGRREPIKRKDIRELRAYITKKKVKDGNDSKFLKNLTKYLEDFLSAKDEEKEEALEWLVEYLTVDHQDFYDKFRDNLRKKKKRTQNKRVQRCSFNTHEKQVAAARRAHDLFPK
ncbi:hypothetical protein NB532_15385 [Vibrio antiquarius]|uniref:hypothetical protein n=1 Tax=Vibrio antiquarius (strain Ex25) TaxID=150340 RepID=UPI0015B65BF5|nr:hypothetical protein [Vibrio antiquarius]MCR9477781.1 hypothetical protein [Vibrio antiquarius]NWK15789.1 hypothetical protein [Vibrio parahaemolyticus]